jgi:hypothetical protein
LSDERAEKTLTKTSEKLFLFFHFSARHGAPHSAIVCWPIRAGRREREEIICTTIAVEEEELYSGGRATMMMTMATRGSIPSCGHQPSQQPTSHKAQQSIDDKDGADLILLSFLKIKRRPVYSR